MTYQHFIPRWAWVFDPAEKNTAEIDSLKLFNRFPSEAALPYPFRCKRHLAQTYTGGIQDRVGDGGRRGDGGRLARAQRRLVRTSISGASENVRIGYVPQSALVMHRSSNRTSSWSARLRDWSAWPLPPVPSYWHAAMDVTPSPLSRRQPASPRTLSVKSRFYA